MTDSSGGCRSRGQQCLAFGGRYDPGSEPAAGAPWCLAARMAHTHPPRVFRVRQRRRWLPYWVMALSLLVVACSKAPTASGLQSKVDPCGGLTAADAAAILKVPAKDLQGPRSNRTYSCSYWSKSHHRVTLNFSLYTEASPAKAVYALDALKQRLAVLSPIIVLKQLGDEAYRVPDPRIGQLLMRKGRVWIEVVTPSDGASQRRIAQIVSEHLP